MAPLLPLGPLSAHYGQLREKAHENLTYHETRLGVLQSTLRTLSGGHLPDKAASKVNRLQAGTFHKAELHTRWPWINLKTPHIPSSQPHTRHYLTSHTTASGNYSQVELRNKELWPTSDGSCSLHEDEDCGCLLSAS
ncbi:Hypothetical predicted protein [Pelobates cultripes]|uniref:Uncharacterized protein n=1 Tax=Pelobates cultripes TaxID=61616 RepID=A0AAD1R3Q1_PELCU|nr:Hypothetical predicted protein [Pelobates cultripes]